MSHFYSVISGQAGKATRCGSKASGLTAAASWSGAIEVRLWHDAEDGVDRYIVDQIPWHGNGARKSIEGGILGEGIPRLAEPTEAETDEVAA